MTANIYVDSTATGSGDAGTSSDPYLSVLSVVAADYDAGGGTTVHIAGEQFLTSKLTALKSGGVGNHHIWTQYADQAAAKIIGGIRISNNSAYKWTASATNGEYYLELFAGGDPSLADPLSGTVDGYYREASLASNNRALEQRATTSVSGDAPVIGSMSATEWGWGDNDTLGYSTVYVKAGVGGHPNDYDIVISQLVEAAEIGFNYHTIDGIQILYSTSHALDAKAIITVQNSILGNADKHAINATSGSCDLTVYNSILTQGHRGISMSAGSASPAAVIANTIFHNNHLACLMARSTGTPTLDVKNSLAIGNESGFADIGSGVTGFTESHNYMSPRLNDSTQKIGYVNASNWPATSDSSTPANYDTDSVIADAASTLRGALISNLNLHDVFKSNFSLKAGSPLQGGGVPISGLTTDYNGDTYHAVSPNIGIYSGTNSGGNSAGFTSIP